MLSHYARPRRAAADEIYGWGTDVSAPAVRTVTPVTEPERDLRSRRSASPTAATAKVHRGCTRVARSLICHSHLVTSPAGDMCDRLRFRRLPPSSARRHRQIAASRIGYIHSGDRLLRHAAIRASTMTRGTNGSKRKRSGDVTVVVPLRAIVIEDHGEAITCAVRELELALFNDGTRGCRVRPIHGGSRASRSRSRSAPRRRSLLSRRHRSPPPR